MNPNALISWWDGDIIMNAQSVEKEIINWNIHTFQNLTTFTDLIHRVENKLPPKPEDSKLRDFYFNPGFKLFGLSNRTTFVEHAADIIRNFFSFNQVAYLQSLAFEHHTEKHRFWTSLYGRPVATQQDHEIKSHVRNIVWTYRLIPLSVFLFGAAAIVKITGIHRMSMRKQGTALIISVFLSEIFVRTKKSSQIFYLIPELSDAKLEAERLQLLNKGLVLDGKINEVEFRPEYVDELIEVADGETEYEQKKEVLEAAGFKVIDRKDYQYL